jgi:hypothetical protein
MIPGYGLALANAFGVSRLVQDLPAVFPGLCRTCRRRFQFVQDLRRFQLCAGLASGVPTFVRDCQNQL